ncbi:MAG TPA: VWA domain-containing protein [Firmicutes bacterium]|nr:VWA domain-containing protein [Bacillota bacterium]
MFLREINIGTVPEEGTDLARAIETGLGAFIEDVDARNRVMIVFTDGESHDSPATLRAASKAAERAVRIYTVGIGSSDGDLIPIHRNGRADYLRDDQGNVVKTRLDDVTLRRVAAETDGAFYRASGTGGELQEILDDINELERTRIAEEQLVTRVDRYQWPLGVAISCLLIVPFVPERRRTGGRT